jgi:hypothetical protein
MSTAASSLVTVGPMAPPSDMRILPALHRIAQPLRIARSLAVARQVAVRVEGWIGSALDQPRPLLKNALESWLTQQVLHALKPIALGAESNHV